MIRATLKATQSAIYSVDLRNQNRGGMPSPTGTGFFVSPDGWFVTAAHVITQDGKSNGPIRTDVDHSWLMEESRPGGFRSEMCQGVAFEYVDPATDVALLTVDFAAKSTREHLRDCTGFCYIEVSSRELEEGEPIYTVGYPLSESRLSVNTPGATIGHAAHSPGVTSAIVASTMETTGIVTTTEDIGVYVLDKALNYGDSGGPTVATSAGKGHALCSRFQPVKVFQTHLRDQQGNPLWTKIPSLYGIVSSLRNRRIVEELQKREVPISDS